MAHPGILKTEKQKNKTKKNKLQLAIPSTWQLCVGCWFLPTAWYCPTTSSRNTKLQLFASSHGPKWLWVKTNVTILVYFSGDWDVHWGMNWILTHAPNLITVPKRGISGAGWLRHIRRKIASGDGRRKKQSKWAATDLGNVEMGVSFQTIPDDYNGSEFAMWRVSIFSDKDHCNSLAHYLRMSHYREQGKLQCSVLGVT